MSYERRGYSIRERSISPYRERMPYYDDRYFRDDYGPARRRVFVDPYMEMTPPRMMRDPYERRRGIDDGYFRDDEEMRHRRRSSGSTPYESHRRASIGGGRRGGRGEQGYREDQLSRDFAMMGRYGKYWPQGLKENDDGSIPLKDLHETWSSKKGFTLDDLIQILRDNQRRPGSGGRKRWELMPEDNPVKVKIHKNMRWSGSGEGRSSSSTNGGDGQERMRLEKQLDEYFAPKKMEVS